MVNELPAITRKTNGFAAGGILKGYFKTNTGEIVKLLLPCADKPCILIVKSSGEKIYYSSKEQPNSTIIAGMKKALPSRVQQQ